MTLVEFLKARLDEDEQTARAAAGDVIDGVVTTESAYRHLRRWGTARVLREVEAKRRIIAAHEGNHECPSEDDNCGWITDGRCATLRLLALPHADHPDYREPGEPRVTPQPASADLSVVTSDTSWMLTLAGHPPVPVTIDEIDGPTTFCRTPVTLPLSPTGQRVTISATLTAPDGSQQAGVGSIDGMAWYTDRTTATKLSFTRLLTDDEAYPFELLRKLMSGTVTVEEVERALTSFLGCHPGELIVESPKPGEVTLALRDQRL